MKHRKRPMPAACAEVHDTVRRNLRRLMDGHVGEGRPAPGIGMIRLAKSAGIGVGSVQSILGDAQHSPSLRVLSLLAAFFKVSVADLVTAARD
jgi:hypothetical protein